MQQLESAINSLREAFEAAKEENYVLKTQNELMRTKIDQLLNQPSNAGFSYSSTFSKQQNDVAQVSVDTYVLAGPTGECKVEKQHDMSVMYFVESGMHTVGSLAPELKKHEIDPYLIEIYDSSVPSSLEQTIANTRVLVVVLSRDCLKQRGFIFGMECAGMYPSVHLVLLHDPATCAFPGYTEQPETVRGFFSEKATTYLEDYASSIALDLVNKVREKSQAQTKAVTHAHTAPEDIRTRLFLSHKRLTAQAIAGRLYEGLKNHYHIFLDSEAHFKIHDLEAIVNNTKVLIFILSSGILDSLWCIKELRTAIKAGKKVIVVRDYSYKLPEHFPVELLDIEHTLKTAPTVTWMAEYNNLCVQKLIDDFIGPDDSFIIEMEKWLQDPAHEETKKLILEHDYSLTHLDLSDWKKSITDFLRGSNLCFGFSGASVEKVTVSHNLSMDENCLAYLFKHFPSLKKLNLQGCSLSDKSLKMLGDSKLEELVLDKAVSSLSRKDFFLNIANLPLKSLSLQRCPLVDQAFLQKLCSARIIQKLDLSMCSQVDDIMLETVSEHLADTLQEIILFMNSKITGKGLRSLARCSLLTSVNLRGCSSVGQEPQASNSEANQAATGLQALLESANKLQYLNIRGLKDCSSDVFRSISTELVELHAENSVIDDQALNHVSSRCSKLVSVQLDFCKKITNAGVQALASCHALQSVGLAGTNITNEGVAHFVRGCPNIHYIHTEGCHVDDQLASIIKESCKHVKYLSFSQQVPHWSSDPKYKNIEEAPVFNEDGLVVWMKAQDVAQYAAIDEPVARWSDSWTSGLVFSWAPDKLGAKVIDKPILTYLPSEFTKAPNTHSLKFTGTAKICAEKTPINIIHNDFTIFLVKKNVKPSNANYFFFSWNGHGPNNDMIGKLHLYEGSTPHTTKFIAQATGPWTADYLNLPSTFPVGDLHVIIYQRKGTVMRLWQHTNQVQEKNGSAGPLMTKPTYTYTIGDDQSFGTSIDSILNPTYMSEIVIFNQALPDERLAEMKLYLQQKYQFKAAIA